jgi:predicted Na+-dependent transporter
MQQQHEDPAFAIRIGLLSVIAFMSWPVWMAIVAGQREFTWAVAWSAAVPVLLTLMVPFVAFHCAERIHHGFTRVEHALHIDTFVHDHMPHRHA